MGTALFHVPISVTIWPTKIQHIQFSMSATGYDMSVLLYHLLTSLYWSTHSFSLPSANYNYSYQISLLSKDTNISVKNEEKHGHYSYQISLLSKDTNTSAKNEEKYGLW